MDTDSRTCQFAEDGDGIPGRTDPVIEDLFRWGVTRVAEQGTLDTIGLPVWSAIRPAARSLCVTNGKGATHAEARRGAIMEALECACAEDSERLVVKEGSVHDLEAAGEPVADFIELLKARTPTPEPNVNRRWVKGAYLETGDPVHAPYELVGLDFRTGALWDRTSFVMTSTGLAAHFDRDSAIASALLEAVEIDARSLAMSVPGLAAAAPRRDADCLDADWARSCLERLGAENIHPELIDITTDIGLPVVLCILRNVDSGWGRRFRHAGCACRGTYRAAAEAAFMEALQSRVTDIAGARDDIAPENFEFMRLAETGPAAIQAPPPSRGCAKPGPSDISALLARAGCGDPLVFDLAPEDAPFACVSVLVPGLELVAEKDRTPRRGGRYRMNALGRLFA